MDNWPNERVRLRSELYRKTPSQLLALRQEWGIPVGVQYMFRNGIIQFIDEAVDEAHDKADGIEPRSRKGH